MNVSNNNTLCFSLKATNKGKFLHTLIVFSLTMDMYSRMIFKNAINLFFLL